MEAVVEGNGDRIHRNIGQWPAFHVGRGNGVCYLEFTARKRAEGAVAMPVLAAPRGCVPRFYRGREMPSSVFDFEIIDCIGEGAGSKIFVVSHEQTQQLYALKHVVKRQEKDARFMEQLENEF